MSEELVELGQLRWQDAVDVILLTVVLYRVFIWLRGTVAIQIAVGMLTLVGLSYAAGLLGFVLTAYVLQGISAVAVLIGVVIFRDEIRRALTRASPLRLLLRRRAPAEDRRDFTAVAEALFALARRRIGALVVVVRRDPIAEHVTGGVRLDAAVSEPLVESIFQKSSPLHDGALIIDGEKMTLAGAFLPLARSELPVRYGTRHSAAVGLSEVSDAIVVAVSEERGEVSVADAGAIHEIPDASTLGRRLGDLVGPMPAAAPVPRRRLHDAFVAAAIFVGVVAAWNVVANRRDTVEERTVQIELHGVPPSLRLEPLPAEVTLRLRGPRRLLVGVTPEDLDAWADASSAARGVTEVSVSGVAASGIEVIGVVPPRVQLLELKDLRVEPQVATRGVRVLSFEPRTVTVIGKVGAFKGFSTIKTLPIAQTDGVVRVHLAIPAEMRVRDPSDSQVEVELTNMR